MTNNIWKYFKVVFIVLLYFLFNTILSYLLKYIGIDVLSLSRNNLIIFLLSSDLILILILILIYRKDLKENIIDYKNSFSTYFTEGFKYWLIGVGIMIISNLIINKYFPGEATNEVIVETTIKSAPMYMFVSSVILGPFIEEMIFRKAFKEVFTSDLIYIILSGLFFGFVHTLAGNSTAELIYIIPYGAVGAAFAYMFAKTKNIFVPITFHIIHNGILVIFYIINSGVLL